MVCREQDYGLVLFSQTVNQVLYKSKMLEPFIGQLRDDELRDYFQQDNAPTHRTNVTLEYLKGYFDNRLIS